MKYKLGLKFVKILWLIVKVATCQIFSDLGFKTLEFV